jgi:hypothetical protein
MRHDTFSLRVSHVAWGDLMGDSTASPSPSLPSSQRPERRECSFGAERGIRCALPADPITLLCQRHDPAQLEARRVQARSAARASHSYGSLTPDEVTALYQGIDLATREGRDTLRARLSRARAEGLAAGLFRDLMSVVDSAAREDQSRAVKAKPGAPVVVVEPYRNGSSS